MSARLELAWLGFAFIMTSAGVYLDLVSILLGFCLDSAGFRFRLDFGLVLVWLGFGFGWIWAGFGLEFYWIWLNLTGFWLDLDFLAA